MREFVEVGTLHVGKKKPWHVKKAERERGRRDCPRRWRHLALLDYLDKFLLIRLQISHGYCKDKRIPVDQ